MSKDGRDLGTCDKCGRELEMWGEPWCEVCDKPERKMLPCLDLIPCLNHIEAKYEMPGYKDRMWDFFLKRDYVMSNDTFEFWPFADEDINDPEIWGLTKQELWDIEVFNETFDIGPNDTVYMNISW